MTLANVRMRAIEAAVAVLTEMLGAPVELWTSERGRERVYREAVKESRKGD